MKNSTLIFSMIALCAGLFANSAFAMDQVKLTNGQIVQGTVLNDVPNRYVDIRLVNGDSKRFEHTDVASVDRDVPSRKDQDMFGNQSHAFVSVLGGGAYQFENELNHTVHPNYGVKVGVISFDNGGYKMGFALSYDRFSESYGSSDGFTAATNDLNLQLLFMRIANSGFYFGPNAGLAILTGSYNSSSMSESKFEAGFGIGYEFFATDTLSIGPDVRYEHIFTDQAYNLLKFDLALNFHF